MNQQMCPEHHAHTRSMGAYQPAVPFTGVIAPLNYIGVTVAELILSGVRCAQQLSDVWRRRRDTRRNTAILANLDDHILKDIGIPREQIHHIARLAAEQPGLRHYRDLIR